MIESLKRNLTVPAWVLIALGVSELLLILLSTHSLWKQQQPQGWTLDSTTYYKFLEGQGKLNLRLYEQQQSHEARLQLLDKKRETRHRHIDSLHGDALQSEIDRRYNSPGRQQPGRSGPKPGPETDSAHRSRRSSGSERQSRSGLPERGGSVTVYIIGREEPGFDCPERYDYPIEREPASEVKRSADSEGPDRKIPSPVARSAVGELDRSNWGRSLPDRKVQAYWILIRDWGYTYPDIAFAISAVETGYFSSLPGHNLFGMKKNGRGFYTSLAAHGYCRYRTKYASLADYGAYEQQMIRKYNLESRADYLRHIKRRFCPTPSYKGKLDLAFDRLAALRSLT